MTTATPLEFWPPNSPYISALRFGGLSQFRRRSRGITRSKGALFVAEPGAQWHRDEVIMGCVLPCGDGPELAALRAAIKGGGSRSSADTFRQSPNLNKVAAERLVSRS